MQPEQQLKLHMWKIKKKARREVHNIEKVKLALSFTFSSDTHSSFFLCSLDEKNSEHFFVSLDEPITMTGIWYEDSSELHIHTHEQLMSLFHANSHLSRKRKKNIINSQAATRQPIFFQTKSHTKRRNASVDYKIRMGNHRFTTIISVSSGRVVFAFSFMS